MPLSAGTRLGAYEILARIGKGGMGEVWKARDPRLGREVAIKVSGELFTERFEREARAIASLNHPNICTLYDVGPDYLVMELIEGETLADRIAQGAIPLEESLRIARQIGDALEAAHEKGITHRDLKPGNIKIRPDGMVKVLDFGLAKLASPAAPQNEDSPTITLGTQVGMILGTAAYMAPEQARGKPVDKRADIWAFGVVLHEMLTGKRLFQGDDLTDTLAAVLRQEPDWQGVPVQTRRLLKRCLEKDPKKRLKDIGDWSGFLDEEAPPPAVASRSSSRIAWITAALFVVVALGLGAWILLQPKVVPQVTKYQIFAPPGSTLPLGTPAPSPDGRVIAYTVRGQDGVVRIHVRGLDSLESRPLSGTEGATHPFWSPDGRSLGFNAEGSLKRIELPGGAARRLTLPSAVWNGSWGTSGVILFNIGPGVGAQVPAEGGAVVPFSLDEKKGETGAGYATFLPDGQHYVIHINGDAYLAALGSTERKLIMKLDGIASLPASTPNGKTFLLFVRDNSLMAQEFGAADGLLRGDPYFLTDQIGRVSPGSNAMPVGVSPQGVLAFQTASSDVRWELGWFDRTGKQLSQLPPAASGGSPRISPDGKSVAIQRLSGNSTGIWLADLARGSASRLTLEGSAILPVWSPDGRRIAFRTATLALAVKDVEGRGREKVLVEGSTPLSWTQDGQILVSDRSGLSVFSPATQKKVPVGRANVLSRRGAEFSPDGKFVAYTSAENGRFEVFVDAVPPATGRWTVSVDGGVTPRWRRDGKELFFLSPDMKMMAVDSQLESGVSFGIPHVLFQTSSPNLNEQLYDVAADGQKFLIASAQDAADVPITVVMNWWAGLQEKGK